METWVDAVTPPMFDAGRPPLEGLSSFRHALTDALNRDGSNELAAVRAQGAWQ